MNPNFNGVGPEFFATLGIPLVAGREFTSADALEAPKVAVVNETFARYFFGDKDPLGRTLRPRPRGRTSRSRSSAWPRTARRPRCARSRCASSICPTPRTRRWAV